MKFFRNGIDIRYVAVGIVCCLVLAVGISVAVGARASAFQDPDAAISYWKVRIQIEGPERAYRDLVVSSSVLTNEQQHQLGHIFGAALYETVGLKGFSVCDANLFYGCYHEFIGRAIAELGLNVISRINTECLDLTNGQSAIGCQHGIGHGLVAYLGYSTSDLTQALGFCDGMDSTDRVRGCDGGAFMEYNLQTMLGGNAKPRSITSSDLAGPCASIPSADAPGCVFWLTQWWFEQLSDVDHMSGTSTFAELGTYCTRVAQTPALSQSCFEGIGYTASPTAQFDVATSAQFCAATSDSLQNRLACWSIAYLEFQTKPTAAAMLPLCDGLPATAALSCRSQLDMMGKSPTPT